MPIVYFDKKIFCIKRWKRDVANYIVIRQNHQLTLTNFMGLIQDIVHWIFWIRTFMVSLHSFFFFVLIQRKQKSRLDSFLNGYEDQ